MATESWSTIAAAIPYGWQINYALKIEGIDLMPVERDVGVSAPTGYTEHECLVIEDSARLGARIGDREGVARGYDLTVHILRTTTTVDYFKAPSNITSLTEDLDYDETTSAVVKDSSGFASSGTIYAGREAIDYASKADSTHFNTLTRGEPSADWRAYDHKAGSGIATWIADAPLFWRGRLVELWAIPVDPYGVAQGSDLLDGACMVWRGHIQARPAAHADGWTLKCRSYDRRLAEKIGVKASGVGRFDSTIDPLITVSVDYSIQIRIDYGTATERFDLEPFASYTPPMATLRLSTIRDLIQQEWVAVQAGLPSPGAGDYIHGDFRWLDQNQPELTSSGVEQVWQAQYEGHTTNSEGIGAIQTGVNSGWVGHGAIKLGANKMGGAAVPDVVMPYTAPGWINLPIKCTAETAINAFTCTLDDTDPAMLPAAGYLIVEAEGRDWFFEYDSVTIEGDGTGSNVSFELQTGSDYNASEMIGELQKSDSAEFSFTVAAKLGPDEPRDLMRTVLMSSGRGDNHGTWDSGDWGTGYDLDAVDVTSFDTELDGQWPLLGEQECGLDDRFSFEDIWGELLALSRRALVSRPNTDGSDVELAVVQKSLVDTGLATLTVTDADLVVSGSGGHPVREVTSERGPNEVRVTLEEVAGRKDGKIAAHDVTAILAEGPQTWSIKTVGMPRSKLAPAVRTWAASMFDADRQERVYELDVVPWLAHGNGDPLRVGDAIRLDLSHFLLWDTATGESGYEGPARVIGLQTRLSDYSTTLTVALAGMVTPYCLAPSAEILDYTGTGTNPTTVQVAGAYYDLMTAYKSGVSDFDLIAYKRGADDATSNGYTINIVSWHAGLGQTQLSVSAVTGSFDISSGTWFLTLPVRSSANTAQGRHLFTDSPGGVWL